MVGVQKFYICHVFLPSLVINEEPLYSTYVLNFNMILTILAAMILIY